MPPAPTPSERDRELLWARRFGHSRVDAVICGPPGSGKTCLAAAMASGSGLPGQGSAAITPLSRTTDLVTAVYQHLKADPGTEPSLPPTSLEPLNVQVMHKDDSEDGSEAVAKEVSLLELEEDALREHPLYRHLCFTPVWILLMDPTGEHTHWYLDRLPQWSEDLAQPDGEAAFPPPTSVASKPLPVTRVTRQVRRVIVVITHLDEVIAQWMPTLQKRRLNHIFGVHQHNDWQGIDRLIRRLDAEAWIRHHDPTFLRRVREYLGGPETEIIVGVVSSVGLRRPSVTQPEWCPFGTGELLELIMRHEIVSPFYRASPESSPRRYLKLDSILSEIAYED